MPALLLLLARVAVAFWGLLVELLPWLQRFGPWLAAIAPGLAAWFRQASGKIAADVAEDTLRGAFAVAVAMAGMVFWAAVLAVFFTGLNGLGIRDIAMENPFSGFPAAMLFLVKSGFPIKFSVSVVESYIVWKFTCGQAALVCARSSKWLFGF